jgi:pterin-4a-carbinolamine dehydratase
MSDKVYSESEIGEKLLAELPVWTYAGGAIRREYKVQAWKGAVMLTNAISHLAELAFHHPDLEVSWGKVVVKLTTHSAGGVTDKDFELARVIEAFAAWAPGPGSSLEGTPDDPKYAYLIRD